MTPADDPTGAPPHAAPSSFAEAFTEPLRAAMSFGKFVPGFDFLEQWTRQAHAALPTMGQWVAPTLDPAELDKRIQDLRTVQFWLEQNARMLAMTIQALEVQRMTLATLQGMNVPVDALRESLKARPAPAPSSRSAAAGGSAGAQASSAPRPADPPAGFPFGGAPAGGGTDAPADTPGSAGIPGAAGDAPAAVDPMRWWGALTQQFTQLAASTMQDALGRDRAQAASPQAPGSSAQDEAAAPPRSRPAQPSASLQSDNRGDNQPDTRADTAPDAPRAPKAKPRSPSDKPARR